VLEDVRHAGSIGRVRLEADGEDIVAVVACDVQVVGARLVVLQMQGGQLELGHVLGADKREAVQLVAGLRILRQLGDGLASRVGCVAKHGGDSGGREGEDEKMTLVVQH